jgi:hypothetical protein
MGGFIFADMRTWLGRSPPDSSLIKLPDMIRTFNLAELTSLAREQILICSATILTGVPVKRVPLQRPLAAAGAFRLYSLGRRISPAPAAMSF